MCLNSLVYCYFPRFVFIIGTSVFLAFTSMQKRGIKRLQLLRKITWRTVVLLLLGFCFLNYSPRDGPRKCKWCSTSCNYYWNKKIICGFTCFVLLKYSLQLIGEKEIIRLDPDLWIKSQSCSSVPGLNERKHAENLHFIIHLGIHRVPLTH